jgi:hypothetical protein
MAISAASEAAMQIFFMTVTSFLFIDLSLARSPPTRLLPNWATGLANDSVTMRFQRT